MFISKARSLALAFCIALTLELGAVAAPPAKPAPLVPIDAEKAHLDSYVKPDGTGYFALSLTPSITVAEPEGRDVVVLFDTSASQAGPFREKGLAVLEELLRDLPVGDRVQLFAVDLDSVPMTKGFAGPQSEEMRTAVAALQQRVPLGSTDLPVALETVVRAFGGGSSDSGSGNGVNGGNTSTSGDEGRRSLAAVYIGDGMSVANLLDVQEFRKLLGELAVKRIAVSSMAVGPRLDANLLAALANQTGGMLVIDGENVAAQPAGLYLAKAVRGVVLWTTDVKWPAALADVVQHQLPPLRLDRDTVVIGRGKLTAECKVAASAEFQGKEYQLSWSVAPCTADDDFAFLAQLFDMATPDSGVTLPTIGRVGLLEARRLLAASTEDLSDLGKQAVDTGNLADAEKLAVEALRRDPNDPMALAVKRKLAEIRASGGKLPVGGKGGLKIEKTRHEQAAPPKSGRNVAIPADASALPPAEAGGDLLENIERENQIISGIIQTQTSNTIKNARMQMANNPLGVKESLKAALEQIRQAPELNTEMRSRLRSELQIMLRESERRQVEKDVRDQAEQAVIASGKERMRLLNAMETKQEKIHQLMDRFNSLMSEGRYLLAEEGPGAEVAAIDPQAPIGIAATLAGRMVRYDQLNMQYRELRQRGVVDALAQAEIAAVPFPDDQTIVYPAKEFWQEMTLRRKKFASVDLKKQSQAEIKIRKALDEPTNLEFVETPLTDVIDYLKDLHGIEIQIDNKALEDAGAGTDTPVTKNLRGISLRSALRLMLGPMDLAFVIKDEVLLITTKEKADAELVTKVYPVADLVLPIKTPVMSGMGGMGGAGGGMGSMMGGGGMGGRGGGMGGGMGGMGGGMGGMGGGGGGMFSVPDSVEQPVTGSSPARPAKGTMKLGSGKLGSGKSSDNSDLSKSNAATAEIRPASPPALKMVKPKSPAPPAAAAATKPAGNVAAIRLTVPEGTSADVVWNDYFAAHPDASPAVVRETARQLMNGRQFDHLVAMLQAAIRSGQPQPWMYEAMGLALQAGGRPKSEVERALMSGVDFSQNPEELNFVAQYMARSGLEERALKIYRQVAVMEPLRPEPYMYGLQLSQRLNSLDGVQWSALGILRQAWPNDKQDTWQTALRAAAAALEQLKHEKRSAEAAAFQAEVDKALERDCIVKVTWTGDADIDMYVEEPSGTVCSFRNPRTTAGGIMMGDTISHKAQASRDGFSELYVCPQAFSGNYRVLLRRVWGKVTAGKLTVEVFSHYGTNNIKRMRATDSDRRSRCRRGV